MPPAEVVSAEEDTASVVDAVVDSAAEVFEDSAAADDVAAAEDFAADDVVVEEVELFEQAASENDSVAAITAAKIFLNFIVLTLSFVSFFIYQPKTADYLIILLRNAFVLSLVGFVKKCSGVDRKSVV